MKAGAADDILSLNRQGNFSEAWKLMRASSPEKLPLNELFLMAMYCREGRKGVEANPELSRELFQLLGERAAAENSRDGKSLFYMGLSALYYKLRPSEALPLFKEAADKGNSDAQLETAIILQKGLGVERDQAQAMDYLHKAVAQNNQTAKAYLASSYLGQSVDIRRGIALTQESSDAGNRAGQYTLAMAYEKGRGVPVDRKKALRLYQLSVDQGLKDAHYRLNGLKRVFHIPREQYIDDDFLKTVEDPECEE